MGKTCRLSLEGFLLKHVVAGSPVIISDSMNHWPAKEKWNDINYLKNVAGFRTIPVEVSPDLSLGGFFNYISRSCSLFCACERILLL